MEYLRIIKEVADSKLDYIMEYGHAKAGVNGPYKNEDTPVRNSAHWIITYSYLYRETGEDRYLKAAKTLSDYLLKKENYGIGGSIYCRTDTRFDNTNGLIGQAWVIEGLISAARLFKDNTFYTAAYNIFKVQKFNTYNCMWEISDCDGRKDFDLTFNHQLWFAASGAMILKYELDEKLKASSDIDEQIKAFLTKANEQYFNVYDNGLIVHVMDYKMNEDEKEYSRNLNKERKIKSLKTNPAKVIGKKFTDKIARFSFTEGLEEGYHIFDLYGFALLKEQYGNHAIFQSEKLKKALEYALDSEILLKLRNSCGGRDFNKFAFGYNSPAFEYPFVAQVFRGEVNKSLRDELFLFQIENTFQNSTFTKNCEDGETLDARIYELVRYLEMTNETVVHEDAKVKICFLTNNIAEFGGRQRVNALLANEMSNSSGIDVSILFTSDYSTAMKQVYPLNERVRVLWDKKLNMGRKELMYKAIRYVNKKIYKIKNTSILQHIYFPSEEVAAYEKFFQQHRFDFVIGVGTRAGAMLSLIKDKSKKIVWLHSTYYAYFQKKDYFQWHQEHLYHKLLSKLDAMVVLTDEEIRRYQEHINCNPVRIYNPITVTCETKSELQENELIYVGRLDYDIKGLDLLVESLSIIKKSIPDFHLTVLGDGNGKVRFKEALLQKGIDKNVTMVGAVDDVVSYYRKASVALLPSRQEAFGLVVTEAMKCGVPVVSFKTQGPSEIINDGIDGFLVDNYNVEDFAEKVILLCKDSKKRMEMGLNAVKRADDFSIDTIIEEWRTLFSSMRGV